MHWLCSPEIQESEACYVTIAMEGGRRWEEASWGWTTKLVGDVEVQAESSRVASSIRLTDSSKPDTYIVAAIAFPMEGDIVLARLGTLYTFQGERTGSPGRELVEPEPVECLLQGNHILVHSS